MTTDQIIEYVNTALGWGLGVLVFAWTRWIVLRAWKKR